MQGAGGLSPRVQLRRSQINPRAELGSAAPATRAKRGPAREMAPFRATSVFLRADKSELWRLRARCRARAGCHLACSSAGARKIRARSWDRLRLRREQRESHISPHGLSYFQAFASGFCMCPETVLTHLTARRRPAGRRVEAGHVATIARHWVEARQATIPSSRC